MASEYELEMQNAPPENSQNGILQVEIPDLGNPTRGKVRDRWSHHDLLILATTDRKSAYDRFICTVTGKGQVLNLLSADWFANTADIIPNHMVMLPHPNILVAKHAAETLPVEVVVRRFMAKSSTSTSVYSNYDKGRRNIYGIDFPDGLQANQEFPIGNIVTPTTKAETGHDEELTDEQASQLVDQKLGDGVWNQAKSAALELFERGRKRSLAKGLLLVDTKYEFGLDRNRDLMLIDEIHTPDSSRYWLASTYQERFNTDQNPETFDKEILRRWLSENGFRGEGPVPKVDPEVIAQMSAAYATPYRMLTGQELPPTDPTQNKLTFKLADILP